MASTRCEIDPVGPRDLAIFGLFDMDHAFGIQACCKGLSKERRHVLHDEHRYAEIGGNFGEKSGESSRASRRDPNDDH